MDCLNKECRMYVEGAPLNCLKSITSSCKDYLKAKTEPVAEVPCSDGVRGQMPNVHFSSKTDLHATPQDFFDTLDKEFKFETDVCALPENHKCERYFTPEQDGLKQAWTGVCWMNPPYGRQIGSWMEKAYKSMWRVQPWCA